MDTMQFSWIPLHMAMNIPSVRNNFIRLMSILATECNLHSDFRFAVAACANKEVPEVLSKTMGLYILHNDRTIYSMALIAKRQIEGVYTPPEYRRQGYAVMLLQEVYNLYKGLDSVHIWAAVADHAVNIFTKAGWKLCSDRINKDGSRDYSPDYSVEAYGRKVTLSDSDMHASFKAYMSRHFAPMMTGMKLMNVTHRQSKAVPQPLLVRPQ
jgi:GNAT superfamily N-acetyltransferase